MWLWYVSCKLASESWNWVLVYMIVNVGEFRPLIGLCCAVVLQVEFVCDEFLFADFDWEVCYAIVPPCCEIWSSLLWLLGFSFIVPGLGALGFVKRAEKKWWLGLGWKKACDCSWKSAVRLVKACSFLDYLDLSWNFDVLYLLDYCWSKK